MIYGITDEKGISKGKLEHIMLGTVNGKGDVSGYHCYKDYSDTKVEAEVKHYPKSTRIITANKNQMLFEAIVRAKGTKRIKKDNNGKSSFFNAKWTRQDVVDCVARIETNKKIIKTYRSFLGSKAKNICVDKTSGLVVMNNTASTYPLLKY